MLYVSVIFITLTQWWIMLVKRWWCKLSNQ